MKRNLKLALSLNMKKEMIAFKIRFNPYSLICNSLSNYMYIKNLKSDVSLLINLRCAISDHLPIKSNLVVFDILMFVLNEYAFNRPLTVKRLFRSLHLSPTGFRHHFRALLDDDWVFLSRMVAPEGDQRLRFVRPSPKLIAGLIEIKRIINDSIEKHFTSERLLEIE